MEDGERHDRECLANSSGSPTANTSIEGRCCPEGPTSGDSAKR